jgi:H+/Cl- antiporter ClcA
LRAFTDPELPHAALAWKILFTCVTLGAGFMGGEVTPLFFIGAVTGNLLARLLGIPLELGAGVGLAATFAAAAKAPLSLTIMALELFGAAVAPHAAIVCFAAAWLTGRRSVYTAQFP